MNKVFRLLTASASAVASLSGIAVAQTAATGNIEGVVTDTTGAVLPGVTVVVRNTGTNVTRELVTDEAGRYRANALQPGVYEVTATLGGFQSAHVRQPRSPGRPDAGRRRQDAGGGRHRDGDGHRPSRRSSTRGAPTSATSLARTAIQNLPDQRTPLGELRAARPRRHQRRELRPGQLPRHLRSLQQQHGRRRRQQPGVLL